MKEPLDHVLCECCYDLDDDDEYEDKAILAGSTPLSSGLHLHNLYAAQKPRAALPTVSHKGQLMKLGSHELCKWCLSETWKDQCPDYKKILERYPLDKVQAVSKVSPHEGRVYQMGSKPRGICLIISNKDFRGSGDRLGTERDVESLSRVFSCLGFRVLLCVDKTAQQMKEVLEGISKLKQDKLEMLNSNSKLNLDVLESLECTSKLNLEILEILQRTSKLDLDVLESLECTSKLDLDVLESLQRTSKLDLDVLESLECTSKLDLEILESLECTSKLDLDVLESLQRTSKLDLDVLESLECTSKLNLEILESLECTFKLKQERLEILQRISKLKQERLEILQRTSKLRHHYTLQSGLYEYTASGDFIPLKERPHHGDAFVCCLMSHGGETGVCGVDGKQLPINQILLPFNGVNCPALNNKPKVFFIQACRGGGKMLGIEGKDAVLEESWVDQKNSNPSEADFLVVRSTVQSYVSYRSAKRGSTFIQTLCSQLISDCPRGEDVLTIMTEVNDKVSQKGGYCKKIHSNKTEEISPTKQISEVSFTLRKRLVLPVEQERCRIL